MIVAIWNSFRRLPLWVQGWMVFLLIPINVISLFFLREPMGVLVCVLAIGGMVPNLFIMAVDRGMSKLMAVPHIFLWTPLCILILWMLIAKLTGSLSFGQTYTSFLVVLLVIDFCSLLFDFPDAWKWYSGDRSIA